MILQPGQHAPALLKMTDGKLIMNWEKTVLQRVQGEILMGTLQLLRCGRSCVWNFSMP